MDQTQKKQYYRDLHAKLAEFYETSPDVINEIRVHSISFHKSQKEIRDLLLHKMNKKLFALKETEKQLLRHKERIQKIEEMIVFISKINSNEFIEITRKDL